MQGPSILFPHGLSYKCNMAQMNDEQRKNLGYFNLEAVNIFNVKSKYRKKKKKKVNIGRMGGRLRREGMWGYMYMYS